MVEIEKTLKAAVTINIKWILSDAEPTVPTDYTRMPELDIALGQLGTLWAFVKSQ